MISDQLLYQRLRNRTIEMFEILSSPEDTADLGAFEVIHLVDDFVPRDYDGAPNVFSDQEKQATAEFMNFVDAASGATTQDIWDVAFFRSSEEWARLSSSSKKALVLFLKRGRFSEVEEELFLRQG